MGKKDMFVVGVKMRRKINIIIFLLILILSIGIIFENRIFLKCYLESSKMGLLNMNSVEIKKAFYCGEGGINCHHTEGYIFIEKEDTIENFINKMKWEKISENKYKRSVDSIKIHDIYPVINGKLIYYWVEGAC